MVLKKVIKFTLAIGILSIFIFILESLNLSSPLFSLILTYSKIFSGLQAFVSLFSYVQFSFSKIQCSQAFNKYNSVYHSFLGV